MSTLNYVAMGFGFFSLLAFLGSFGALRRGEYIQLTTQLIFSLAFFFLAALFALSALSIRGYSGFTHEELAATVWVTPLQKESFQAEFIFSDGKVQTFTLSGDELFVEAHIIKWQPIAHLIGLHTSYALSRVTGRYLSVQDEVTKPRTVYALDHKDKWFDLFTLRKRFAYLHVLFDAQYGSASFIPIKNVQQYKLMVTTSGLIFRPMAHDV